MLAPSEKVSATTTTTASTLSSRAATRSRANSNPEQNIASNSLSNTGIAVPLTQQRNITEWLQENANATDGFAGIRYNEAGDERVATALNGFSSLGALTAPEKRFLIALATQQWRESGNSRNLHDAASHLHDSEARHMLAEAYAAPTADDQRLYAQGGHILTTAQDQQIKHEMLKIAVSLDPAAVTNAFAGREGALGRIAGNFDPTQRNSLTNAVASGDVARADEGISKLVTAIFLKSSADDIAEKDYCKNLSGALARVMAFAENPAITTGSLARIDELAIRYESILTTAGGRDLLVNDKIMPELRGWAISQIAHNPAWTAEALKNGWEGPLVSAAYSAPIMQRYLARGTTPQTLGGEALRNTLGQALGIPPDRLPSAKESSEATEQRLNAGMNYPYYGPNERIDAIARQIRSIGGESAIVALKPVAVTSNEFGAATFHLFEIKAQDGKTYFLDDADPGRRYNSLTDWRENNRLPPGQMTHQTGASLTTEATPQVTDSLGEWARKIGDGVALAAGIVAGAALLIGSTSNASQIAAGAAGLQMAANTADIAAASDQAHDLASQWHQLDNGQRAVGLLNLAFWGGITAASTRAAGGAINDAHSFARLKNHIEFGAPYPVSRNASLPPGHMRVAYEPHTEVWATRIRIEHGSAAPDQAMLARHSRVARQMERSSNLLQRVSRWLGVTQDAPAGTAAWEAQFELKKIQQESRTIAADLTNPQLTPPDRAHLHLRLEELELATHEQTTRLGQLEQLGDGWVAAPARGAMQAKELGWPEPPTGYTWVAGLSQPHLRRLDPNDSTRLYYNPDARLFTETVGKPLMPCVGHGENSVTWSTNDQGETVSASAVLKEYYSFAGRSVDELSAQETSRVKGLADDQAGHIVGHRFVLDQGLKNYFLRMPISIRVRIKRWKMSWPIGLRQGVP